MKYSKRLEDIKEKYSEVTVLEYINDIEIVGAEWDDYKEIREYLKETYGVETYV